MGVDYGKYFKKYFQDYKGKIVSDQIVELSQVDFRTELTKIKSQNPDVIFIVQLAGSLGNFIKQTKELGIKSIVISNSEAEDPNMLKVAGESAEGFIILSAEPLEKTEAMLDFEKKYKEKFGDLPDDLAANAYDSLILQVIVYEKCKGDAECMKNELHKIKDYKGVSGVITIQADGSSLKPTMFKIIKNGTFVKYEE